MDKNKDVASTLSIIRAGQKDADRRAVVREATSALHRIAPRIVEDAVAAYRSGGDPAAAIRARVDELAASVADAMTMADLVSRDRSLRARRSVTRIALARAVRPELQYLRDRINVSDRELAQLRRTYGSVAYDSTGGLAKRVTKASIRAVNEAVGKGMGVREGSDLLRSAMEDAGLGARNQSFYVTIYRTETSKAYAAAQWRTNTAPAVAEILWGYEYVTIGDDRVRPAHAAMDGVRRKRDDAFWLRWFPPNGYSCRCTASEIFVDDPAPMRRQTRVPAGHAPDEGFGFNPGRILSAT